MELFSTLSRPLGAIFADPREAYIQSKNLSNIDDENGLD
jgi:hypothetical protein